MTALLNRVTSRGPLNRAHTNKAAVVATAPPDATRPRRRGAGVNEALLEFVEQRDKKLPGG